MSDPHYSDLEPPGAAAAGGDLDHWLNQLDSVAKSLEAEEPEQVKVKRRSRAPQPHSKTSVQAQRISRYHLKDHKPKELDDILGELCSLEQQLEEAEALSNGAPSQQPAADGLNGRPQQQAEGADSSPTVSPRHNTSDGPLRRKINSVHEEVASAPGDESSRQELLRQEKVKLIQEKLPEVRKLFVRVYSPADASSKALVLQENTSSAQCVLAMAQKNHVLLKLQQAIVEELPDMQMERVYEDHEFLVDNMVHWVESSSNRLVFTEREDKYDLFVHPEHYLDRAPLSEKKKKKERTTPTPQQRERLVLDCFCEKRTAPLMEGVLQAKSEGKRKWSKHYCLVLPSGLWYNPKGKTPAKHPDKDHVLVSSLTADHVYRGTGWKKTLKAPTDFGFALKPVSVQIAEAKDVKYLCVDSSSDLQLWLTALRIAKYGSQLLQNMVEQQRQVETYRLPSQAQPTAVPAGSDALYAQPARRVPPSGEETREEPLYERVENRVTKLQADSDQGELARQSVNCYNIQTLEFSALPPPVPDKQLSQQELDEVTQFRTQPDQQPEVQQAEIYQPAVQEAVVTEVTEIVTEVVEEPEAEESPAPELPAPPVEVPPAPVEPVVHVQMHGQLSEELGGAAALDAPVPVYQPEVPYSCPVDAAYSPGGTAAGYRPLQLSAEPLSDEDPDYDNVEPGAPGYTEPADAVTPQTPTEQFTYPDPPPSSELTTPVAPEPQPMELSPPPPEPPEALQPADLPAPREVAPRDPEIVYDPETKTMQRIVRIDVSKGEKLPFEVPQGVKQIVEVTETRVNVKEEVENDAVKTATLKSSGRWAGSGERLGSQASLGSHSSLLRTRKAFASQESLKSNDSLDADEHLGAASVGGSSHSGGGERAATPQSTHSSQRLESVSMAGSQDSLDSTGVGPDGLPWKVLRKKHKAQPKVPAQPSWTLRKATAKKSIDEPESSSLPHVLSTLPRGSASGSAQPPGRVRGRRAMGGSSGSLGRSQESLDSLPAAPTLLLGARHGSVSSQSSRGTPVAGRQQGRQAKGVGKRLLQDEGLQKASSEPMLDRPDRSEPAGQRVLETVQTVNVVEELLEEQSEATPIRVHTYTRTHRPESQNSDEVDSPRGVTPVSPALSNNSRPEAPPSPPAVENTPQPLEDQSITAPESASVPEPPVAALQQAEPAAPSPPPSPPPVLPEEVAAVKLKPEEMIMDLNQIVGNLNKTLERQKPSSPGPAATLPRTAPAPSNTLSRTPAQGARRWAGRATPSTPAASVTPAEPSSGTTPRRWQGGPRAASQPKPDAPQAVHVTPVAVERRKEPGLSAVDAHGKQLDVQEATSRRRSMEIDPTLRVSVSSPPPQELQPEVEEAPEPFRPGYNAPHTLPKPKAPPPVARKPANQPSELEQRLQRRLDRISQVEEGLLPAATQELTPRSPVSPPPPAAHKPAPPPVAPKRPRSNRLSADLTVGGIAEAGLDPAPEAGAREAQPAEPAEKFENEAEEKPVANAEQKLEDKPARKLEDKSEEKPAEPSIDVLPDVVQDVAAAAGNGARGATPPPDPSLPDLRPTEPTPALLPAELPDFPPPPADCAPPPVTVSSDDPVDSSELSAPPLPDAPPPMSRSVETEV